MRIDLLHIIGAFLLPVTIAQAESFNNLTSSINSTTTINSTISSVQGLLSSGDVLLGDWQAAYDKAVALVTKLTNDEKVSIITGGSAVGSLANWTALEFKDSTQGPQGYDYITGWSLTSALVMTWDKTLMASQLRSAAAEFYGKGFQVANAPVSQPLGRNPYVGRLDEGMGTDPYLNGIAFGIGAKSFSDVGVVPGGKHWLLNEQETNRMSQGSSSSIAPYSSEVDDKTLHETYMWSFYDGVKNGMGAIMCAMTKVNGTLSCENENLLQNLLKTELGFPGLVTPDVGGQTNAYTSAQGGLDYGSSSYWTNTTVQEGINNGSFSQALLDDKVIRNVIGYYYVGLDNGTQPALCSSSDYVDVRANHASIVREVGGAAMALLKNTNNALPLSKPLSIAMFGSGAGPVMAGPNYVFGVTGTPDTYEGHLAGGAGSGQTSFPYLITPHQAITARAASDGTMIRWILNNTYTSSTSSGMGMGGGGGGFGFGNSTSSDNSTVVSNSTGMGIGGGGGEAAGTLALLSGGTALTQTIPDYATTAAVCLVFINAFSGEGADRTELRNIEQDTLVTTVAGSCNNTIVVINSVGPRILDTWVENENVTAIIYGGLLGQESGNSIADVLYGDVNPSARLAYTIAKNESDYNVGICETAVCTFTEGNYIDYKHFDNVNITPRYEFGYGLSYTTFTYGDLSITYKNASALANSYPTGALSVGGKADLWDEVISLSVSISNDGSLDGNEVAQLYVTFPDAADMPIRQLRGFERVLITSGESKTVNFSLRRRDISFWDVARQEWKIARGDYVFRVGASSRDFRGNVTLTI